MNRVEWLRLQSQFLSLELGPWLYHTFSCMVWDEDSLPEALTASSGDENTALQLRLQACYSAV